MAQLNCGSCNPALHMSCQHQQPQQPYPPQQQWMNSGMNGSNMSLNLPQSGYYPHQGENAPPPTWMNAWGPYPYPYPMGMVPVGMFLLKLSFIGKLIIENILQVQCSHLYVHDHHHDHNQEHTHQLSVLNQDDQ